VLGESCLRFQWMFGLKGLRRRRLRRQGIPREWRWVLEQEVLLYRRLPLRDREELHGHLQVLLAEKRFLGAWGIEVSQEMRLVVLAHAALLLLHRPTDYYPHFRTVILFPTTYLAPQRVMGAGGVVIEGYEARSGESWQRGPVVLSWEEARRSARGELGCRNIILHEFAHQLDYEDGFAEGAPALPSPEMYRSWAATFSREYARLQDALEMGKETLLDPYGARSPAEFFAVATEAFFMCPRELQAGHPGLYRELSTYYRQDPASW